MKILETFPNIIFMFHLIIWSEIICYHEFIHAFRKSIFTCLELSITLKISRFQSKVQSSELSWRDTSDGLSNRKIQIQYYYYFPLYLPETHSTQIKITPLVFLPSWSLKTCQFILWDHFFHGYQLALIPQPSWKSPLCYLCTKVIQVDFMCETFNNEAGIIILHRLIIYDHNKPEKYILGIIYINEKWKSFMLILIRTIVHW